MIQVVVYIISCPFVWLLATSQNVLCLQLNWCIFWFWPGIRIPINFQNCMWFRNELKDYFHSFVRYGCNSTQNFTERKEKKSVNRILSKKPIFHFLYKSLDNPSNYHWTEWSTASALLTWLMLHFEATFMLKWCTFGEQQISNFLYNWGFSWLWQI